MKRFLILFFVVAMIAASVGPALAEDTDTPSAAASFLSNVDLTIAYGYSFRQKCGVDIAMFGIELLTPSLAGQVVPINLNLVILAESLNDKPIIGPGLSAILTDAKYALNIGIGYLPADYGWTATVGITTGF